MSRFFPIASELSVTGRLPASAALSRRSLLGGALALPAAALSAPARAQAGRWTNIPGSAYDIGAGPAGKVFAIGRNASGDGYGVYRWNGKTGAGAWDAMPGGAKEVAVDGSGVPWVVANGGGIYRWNGARWDKLPGSARDIGAGGGAVYVIGSNQAPGGFGIYRWNGKMTGDAWDRVAGGATRIDVDDSGSPWVVNSDGAIYLWSGSQFDRIPGKAYDIGAGGAEVYVIGSNAVAGGYGIYRWAGVGPKPWDNIPGGAVRVAVDGAGKPWVVNDAGAIYRG